MTASEALACTAIEFGLLLLLATWGGLIFIAIGIIAYLIARATYKPPPPFAIPGAIRPTPSHAASHRVRPFPKPPYCSAGTNPDGGAAYFQHLAASWCPDHSSRDNTCPGSPS
jgi:hypothetical protein